MDQSDLVIPQSLRPWPLGLKSVVAQDYWDLEQASMAYRQWLPVTNFRSQVPQAFFHQLVGHLRVNDTVLATCSGTRNSFELEGCASVELVLCIHGSALVEMPQGFARAGAGGAVVVPPGNRLASGHRSVVVTGFEPKSLAAVAATMAGLDSVPVALAQSTASISPLSITPGPQASAIHGLVQYIDTCNGAGSGIAGRLGLDDVLQRLVAGLLQPQLLEVEPSDLGRHRERRGRSSFDELIDYIRANLDQPLRLSDLEARSSYSRRALQYAFRDKLGTTPTAWIREQRLAIAKQQLESDEGTTLSIKAVALGCGYRHLGLFSSDFKRRYGLTPAQVRRPPLQ